MILGILSDTHDHPDITQIALASLKSHGAEFFIHCGDVGGQAVLDLFARIPIAMVWGNTDYERAELMAYAQTLGIKIYDPMASLELDGKKIAVTHGDDFRLMQRLEAARQYDYLFHGHTHVARDQRLGTMRIINPGALHRTSRKTVATLDLATDVLQYLNVV